MLLFSKKLIFANFFLAFNVYLILEANKFIKNGGGFIHESLETFFLDTLQKLAGQQSILELEGSREFKEFALSDTSNIDITFSSPQEIIARSGYDY